MFNELITLENIFCAWYGFKKGKQNKPDVLMFERNLEDNLFGLYENLTMKTYHHQGYHTFHIYDPKFRVINKATVRDRVVHHLVFNYLEQIFQPTFIERSYACQRGKGIHRSVQDVRAVLRYASKNYTRVVWSLKMDIKKFFASVDHDVLFELIKKKIFDKEILWLLEEIIKSFTSPDQIGKGVPIGNLTSQIFSNIYLSELDYFVKSNLQENFYFRYADDFIFLHPDRQHLERLENKICAFVSNNLKLTVHPNKIIYRKLGQGIDWLGYVLLPYHSVLRTSTKKRMFKKIKRKVDMCNYGLLSAEKLSSSLESYFGLLKHCNGYKIEQKLRNEFWLNFAFDKNR
ncbi:MAG: reverse transcriptase/maturase family protein [Candidatus Magasanikbacteria bacterium]